MLKGTKSMPSCSSSSPKVKRKAPELTSVPMRPKRSPSKTMQMAFKSEPVASTVALTSPNTIRLKYSAGPNWKASSVKGGAKAAIKSVATHPAKKLPMAAIPKAEPARPRLAIMWPSRHVTTAEASPGMLTRMAVVEPP